MIELRCFGVLVLVCSGVLPLGVGCQRSREKPLMSRSQTLAELRVVKRGVAVVPPGEAPRAPYPRERLVDGEEIRIEPGGLAWLRRDGGATLLIAGPATLTLRADAIEARQGKIFADTQGGAAASLGTPRGALQLAGARASVEVLANGTVSAYVLQGGIQTATGVAAKPGELLTLTADGKASKVPAVAWDDWTGGLATADPVAQPAPFGIGTVGARKPGAKGEARFALAIQRLDVHVSVDGDFATTEVDELFFNPSSDTVEGIYKFRTPAGAVLQRFGVDRDGSLVWGRVKEKKAAAAQYESHVYEGSTEDPALLEWAAPGVFQARLYPIPAGATRRVVTRYGEWLGRQGEKGERRLYVYPMAAQGAAAALPRIEELSVDFDLSRTRTTEVRVGMLGKQEGKRVLVKGFDVVPRSDLALELFDTTAPVLQAFRARHTVDRETTPRDQIEAAESNAKGESDYLLVPVRPGHASEPKGGLDLAIVVDGSAATDPGSLAIARSMTTALLAHLGPADRAAVWAGDASLRPVAAGTDQLGVIDGAARERIEAGLAQLDRGGATDLGAIVSEAAARLDPTRRGAIVYLGDGQPTVGELATPELRARLDRLPRPVRLFAMGIGDRANMGLLQGIARGGFAEQVTDGFGAAESALRVLEQAEREVWLGAKIDLGPGVDRVFPRELGALAADETALVVGRIIGAPPTELRIESASGKRSQRLAVLPLSDGGDLRRRWAGGRLDQLLDEGAGRAAIVEVGTRFGVITPLTSLYVPTTDELRKENASEPEPVADAGGKPWWRWPWFANRLAPVSYAAREEVVEQDADNKEGGTGTRAKGEEGSMGSPQRRASNKRYAVQGPRDAPTSAAAAAPEQAKREAAEMGTMGVLSSGAVGDPAAPTAPWGRDTSLGNDPLDSAAKSFGDEIGDAFGAGSLGLSGIGEGGGGVGKDDGVGLGSIGTLGHGAGTGTGQGFGAGHGRLGGSHRAKGPTIRMGQTMVSGRLPPEVIQRIVRQNYGHFRVCYDAAKAPVEGRVGVRFVIGRDGSVSNVSNAGSDLPDNDVIQCIVRSFYGLSFPQPEGGIVTVVYPLMLSDGGGGGSPSTPPPQAAAAPAAQAAAVPARAGPAHAAATTVAVQVTLGAIGRQPRPCPPSADLAFDERRLLWLERLGGTGGVPERVAEIYRLSLQRCEVPTWRDRGQFLTMLVEAIPSVTHRVGLWRLLSGNPRAADIVYRAILTRVTTAEQIRELHQALGIRHVDMAVVDKALEGKESPAERAELLRGLVAKWPDDLELALRLLDAHEDAANDASGRALARTLRRRSDATTRVRTSVGEYYLRLSATAKAKGAATAADLDAVEARRTFGEIVEFSPEDPGARRRLGDLLRAHGWFEEAFRQYETLARLTPDDASVSLLLAGAAQGMGRVEEAIRWTEKANGEGSDGGGPLGVTSRALASAYLAWARDEAMRAGRKEEAVRLKARAQRLAAAGGQGTSNVRLILTWSHPELHPAFWSNALGAPMPVADGHPLLGVAQAMLPLSKTDGFVELRLEPADAERARRLHAEATLTAIVDEGGDAERIARMTVSYAPGGAKGELRRFRMDAGALREEAL